MTMASNPVSENGCGESLELTRRMLGLIEEGRWDEAAILEADRLAVIRREFSNETGRDVEKKIETLREIEVLHREMELIVRQYRDTLSTQLCQIAQGRKAGKAYQKNRGY
jgi:hypothetical protein